MVLCTEENPKREKIQSQSALLNKTCGDPVFIRFWKVIDQEENLFL